MEKKTLAKILTYSGILPFIACAVYVVFADDIPFVQISAMDVLLAYGAIIASFIAGIHWGIYLFKDAPLNLFIHSNVIALLAWGSLLFPPLMSAGILILCFGYLLVIDRSVFQAGIYEDWFYQLRLHASCAVIGSLMLAIIALLF
jgi:hypothetical protein|tara:strand:- start:1492 stop:1926 length:435 start_codon:yes stop_codon:yes gene_type:complete